MARKFDANRKAIIKALQRVCADSGSEALDEVIEALRCADAGILHPLFTQARSNRRNGAYYLEQIRLLAEAEHLFAGGMKRWAADLEIERANHMCEGRLKNWRKAMPEAFRPRLERELEKARAFEKKNKSPENRD